MASCYGGAEYAQATVIFEDDFSLRPAGSGVFGAPPLIQNTGGATYSRSPRLALATQGTVGHYGNPNLGVKGLLFNPLDPENTPQQDRLAGTWGQNMYLPYNVAVGSDTLRLTIVARQAAIWNNFAFGFVGSDGILSQMLLLKREPAPEHPNRTSIQLYHNGQIYQDEHLPGIDTNAFREFVLQYDPTRVNTPGVNPYTLSVDGSDIAINTVPQGGGADVGLPAMNPNSIGGVGWGFWFGDGNLDRTVLIQSIKLERLESAGLPGDYNADGIVDAADYVVWRRGDATGDFSTWRANFGAGKGSGAPFAIPEPSAAAWLTFLFALVAAPRARGRHSSAPLGINTFTRAAKPPARRGLV